MCWARPAWTSIQAKLQGPCAVGYSNLYIMISMISSQFTGKKSQLQVKNWTKNLKSLKQGLHHCYSVKMIKVVNYWEKTMKYEISTRRTII